MNSIFKKELHDFNLLCEKYFPGTKPISRYMCMDQLDAAIQKKRGAYTEDMTRDWMSILYVCLAAPDCYFFETSRPKKKIIKFIQSQHSFAEALEQERTDERAMYTCIDSVRDFYRNAKSYAARFNSACPPTFKDLKESVYQALKDQIKENPKLRDFEKNYLSTLNRVFLENCKYLKSPIFFLFLPYYLFFELAKCEGLIKGDPDTVNAFGCVSLGDDKPRWSIRNPPFTEGKVDPKQVSSLYQLVESALCEELQKQDHYSVGQELWQTNYESQLDTPNSCCYTEENKQQILARDAIAFSVPFWQYGAWGSIFTNAFFPCDPYEDERKRQKELEIDIHKLLSLEFRGSRQSNIGREKILTKYANCIICLRKQEFRLPELLTALCGVYSLSYYGEPQSEDTERNANTELLTGFLIANDRLPLWMIDASAKEQRLAIIREGHPNGAFEQRSTDSSDITGRFLCSPSRILFNAAFMRWNTSSIEKPMRYVLADTLPYGRSMEKFSDALYGALCSEKALLRDILVWGGVKVLLDEDHVCSLAEAFHVWSIWHPDAADLYRELERKLKKEPEILDGIAKGPKVPLSKSAEPVELDLSDYEFEQQLSDELVESKNWILEQLGADGKTFGKAKHLNDFRYVMILFTVFRQLRDRMCQQAYDIYIKISDNHLGPPAMFAGVVVEIVDQDDVDGGKSGS